MKAGWYSDLTKTEKRTFMAAFGGLALDAMDSVMFPLLTGTLIVVMGITHPQAGLFATANALGAAIGGWVFGILADRIGRTKVLQITVLLVALSTFTASFANSFEQLLLARLLQGFGYGGEAAVGAVLVAEVVAPAFRGRVAGAVQSGYAFGNALSTLMLPIILGSTAPDVGWRLMFAIGLVPAIIVFFVRRLVPEPKLFVSATEMQDQQGGNRPSTWVIFKAPHRRNTIISTLFAMGALGAAHVMITWLPTYVQLVLGKPLKEMAGYLGINILGSFFGPLIFGWLSHRLGHRPAFSIFLVLQAVNVILFTQMPLGVATTVILGFFLGAFQAGIASGIMPTFSELFPTAVRATGAGFGLSVGRGIGSVMPAFVGLMSVQLGLGTAMMFGACIGYSIALFMLFFLPRQAGVDLSTLDATGKPEATPTTIFPKGAHQ